MKRSELVRKLPIIKEILRIDKSLKNYREQFLTTLLNGFFESVIVSIAIGILLLALAIYFLIIGRIVHKTFKK